MSNKDQKILVNLDIYGDEIVRGNETVTGVVSANALITQHLTSYNYSFIQTLSVNSVSGIYYGDGYNITNINSNNITGVIPITAGGTGASNSVNALQNLGGVASNILSSAYGVATLDQNTYLKSSQFPILVGDVTTLGGNLSTTVSKIQGQIISSNVPVIGQIFQWDGTQWKPTTLPTGGSGGGGIAYYLNYGLSANSPTAGLSGTVYQLGRIATNTLSAVTFNNVSQTNWNTLATFATDRLDPHVTTIAAGIWDLNVWASSTASTQTQMTLRYLVYTYNESLSSTTLLATSDIYNVYDPSVVAQYVISMIVPQTTIDINSRLYFVLQAQATSPNKSVTIYYNNGRPTHVHTTIPSVGGTGLVKVISGVYQNPASLLVDVDVASNAQINQTKISGLTAALDSKFDKSGGTVIGNLTVTGAFSTVNTDKWQNTYTTVSSNSSKWESVYSNVNPNSSNWSQVYTNVFNLSNNWQLTYANVSSSSANWNTAYSSTTGLNLIYLPLSGGTVIGDLTVTGVFSTINTNNWTNIYTTVSSNSAKWESSYTTLNSNSASYVTLTGTQTLTNKTVIDWMTLVRGYNTTPTLLTSLVNGDVYSYIYNSSPSNITYYRFIATDGSEDKFYSYFSGNTLSGLIASKSIFI